MSNTTSLPDQLASIQINGSIEDVWAEITRRDGIQRAMFNTHLESDLEPGAKMRYYSPDRKLIYVVGKVVEIDPPRKLVHTYRFTELGESESLVTWELEELPGAVRVSILHSGFTDQLKTHKRVGGGWNTILKILKDVVEKDRISFGARMLWGMMAAFAFIAPKAQHADRVIERGD